MNDELRLGHILTSQSSWQESGWDVSHIKVTFAVSRALRTGLRFTEWVILKNLE